MPCADSRVRLRKTAPPGMNASACVGRSAPPDSTRLISGSRLTSAISCARSDLRSVNGLLVPPRTVGSERADHALDALDDADAATLDAPTWKSVCQAMNGCSSRNGESRSSSSSMRSRRQQLAALAVALDVALAAAAARRGQQLVELGQPGLHRLPCLACAAGARGSSVEVRTGTVGQYAGNDWPDGQPLGPVQRVGGIGERRLGKAAGALRLRPRWNRPVTRFLRRTTASRFPPAQRA